MRKYLFYIVFLISLFFNVFEVNAATVSKINYGVRYYNVNNGAIQNTAFVSSLSNLPVMIVSQYNPNYSSFTSYKLSGIQFSMISPIQQTGISYVIDLSFTISVQGMQMLLSNPNEVLNTFVRFEQGVILQETRSYKINSVSNSYVNITLHNVVNLQSSTALSSIAGSVMGSIGACSNDYGAMIPYCETNGVHAQLANVNLNVVISQDPNTALLGNISDSIDNVDKGVKDIKNSINNSDTTSSTSEAGDFFSGFTTNTYGLTSIITAPLVLIGSITSQSCSPLGLPLPFVNATLDLPCMSTIYSNHFGGFLTLYQTITTGIISYWVLVRLLALTKDFKNPEHDEIEVLDL